MTKEQEAFMRGYMAALKERSGPSLLDQQILGHRAVRGGDNLPANLVADPELIGDRSVEGVRSGFLQSIIWAIVGAMAGLGVGSTVGAPLQGAAAGGALGSALGYPIGNVAGQLGADRRYLAQRGIVASRPLPLKEVLLHPALSSAAPITSYTRLRRVEG